MKIQKALIYFLSVSVLCVQCNVEVNVQEKLAKKFVDSLLNDSVALESIADRFIRYQHDEKGKEFIVSYLGTMRSYLKKEITNGEDLSIVSFRKAKDQFDGLMITEDEKNQVYAVLTKDNKLLIPLLIKNNQIVSFTTLDKGERRVFMGYGK